VSADDITLVDPSIAKCSVDTSKNEVSIINTFGTKSFPKNGPTFSFSVSATGKNPAKACGFI